LPTLPSFFYTATPASETYTLSLHDALPISAHFLIGTEGEVHAPLGAEVLADQGLHGLEHPEEVVFVVERPAAPHVAVRNAPAERDRKSTRLNSSHVAISYAVFCLKKKNKHE